MIDDLESIIAEGFNSRAAHPEFLKDLQSIIDQYRIPKKIVFFSDDFSDNDFTHGPTWTVSTGEYSVDRYGSLFSSIAIRRPSPQETPGKEADGDPNLRFLLGVLNELAKDGKDQAPDSEEAPEQALIYSTAAIPNSFNLLFSFRSAANWGSTSIGVFLGDDPRTGYHLVYRASPAEGRPMQLIRYRYGKPYIIAEIIENSPDLDDDRDHILQLKRASNGDMVIIVDGSEILHTSDLTYMDDFTGVAIMNNGGSYSYDDTELFIAQ